MVDLILIAKVCGAVMGIGLFLLWVAKLHRDIFVAPWIDKKLQPIQEKVDIIARLMRDKYREEYEQAEEDLLQDKKMKGLP